MKIKANINLGGLVAAGMSAYAQKTGMEIKMEQVPDFSINIETEFSLDEAKGMYELQKQMLQETPEIASNFVMEIMEKARIGQKRFNEIDREIESEFYNELELRAKLRETAEQAKAESKAE